MIKGVESITFRPVSWFSFQIGYELRRPDRDGLWQLGLAYEPGLGLIINLIFIYFYFNKLKDI